MKRFNRRWFNWHTPDWNVKKTSIVLAEVYRRYSKDGHWWGVSVLQVGTRRHLAYIGRSPGYTAREVWEWSFLFMRRRAQRG